MWHLSTPMASQRISVAAISTGLGQAISKPTPGKSAEDAMQAVDKLIVVRPPLAWIKWGLVGKDELWTLDKTVYGLRMSPKWWVAPEYVLGCLGDVWIRRALCQQENYLSW